MMKEGRESTELRRYRIEGRVQRVGFRMWTRRMAEELGLVGRVRNEDDGSVEVCASGPTDALDALGDALLEGPAMARVSAVRREDPGEASDLPEAWSTFEIERR